MKKTFGSLQINFTVGMQRETEREREKDRLTETDESKCKQVQNLTIM